jgi:membrane protease YdiL (CAAX protease family)
MSAFMRPVAALVLSVAVLVTALASYFAFLPRGQGMVTFWLLAGGPTLVLGVLAAAWAKHEGLLREWLTPRWGDFSRGVASAVLLFGVAWAFTRLVAPVGSPREVWLVTLYGQIGDPRVLQAHAPLVAVGIAVVALAEELVWRGLVTQLLADRVGTRTAWIWAAVLYALAFVPTAWALRAGGVGVGSAVGVGGAVGVGVAMGRSGASLDPLLILAALGAGLLWGAMARAFGRLTPGVLAHALFDWALVMMFPLWGVR